MGDTLAEAFRSDLPCDASSASELAALARARVPRITGSAEDTDEDLVLRLRDPKVLGSFVADLLEERRLPVAIRTALAERVFDLLPLPRSEGEVIAVESRAPPRLLVLAASLADSQGLTVLHVMHLVFAVFLDRSLVMSVPLRTRSAVMRAIVVQGETSESLGLLYAGLHLSAVPDREAAGELRKILGSSALPRRFRLELAALAASKDGGRSSLAKIAQKEGLLPSVPDDGQAVAILANIPRLPERLQRTGQRFLKRSP